MPILLCDKDIRYLFGLFSVNLTVEDRKPGVSGELFCGKYKHFITFYFLNSYISSFTFRSGVLYDNMIIEFFDISFSKMFFHLYMRNLIIVETKIHDIYYNLSRKFRKK
jgi:hypothetical protein